MFEGIYPRVGSPYPRVCTQPYVHEPLKSCGSISKAFLGFTMGIPQVQFSNTVPLPVNTVTIVGEGMTPYIFGYGVIPKNIKLLCCPSSHQSHRHFHNFLHVLHPLHVLNLTKYHHMPEMRGGAAETCWWGGKSRGWGPRPGRMGCVGVGQLGASTYGNESLLLHCVVPDRHHPVPTR